jgi:multiple sugar transport system permease protein
LILAPFVWIALSSFKSQIQILTNAMVFEPVLDNYIELLFSRSASFHHSIGNSLVVAAASTLVALAIAASAAFTLVRLALPGWLRGAVFGWALLFHMLPTITFVGPWYVMLGWAGLTNTYLGLVLANVTHHLPMALWIVAAFMRDIPQEILDAARIDGCDEPTSFRRIVLPLVMPGLAAAGALVFLFSWNDFIVALNLTAADMRTAPVAIATFAQEHEVKYGAMAASAMLTTLPALLLLLLGQRLIVRGLLSGAVK